MKLDLYKQVYLIGVGGIGMSALARYFNSRGINVYGYDKQRSELCIELEKEGVNISYSDDDLVVRDLLKTIEDDDLLVIYTSAISRDNQIFLFFQDKKFKMLKRAEALGIISKEAFTIAIAGTHGKTTTSTMLAHILKHAGKQVTAFLGGISRNYTTNLLLAEEAKVLIVEADEFDRSFLYIYPDIAIITSVSADHLDVYEDKQDLELTFRKFASQVKEKGLLLVEKSITLDLSVSENVEKLTYSAKEKADYFANNISIEKGKMVFDMLLDQQYITVKQPFMISKDLAQKEKKEIRHKIKFNMPGVHNISNAVAASAVAFYLGLAYDDILEGLATFKGITRRFDKHIDTEKLVYIDDYAHHPEEVSVTIDTTKELYPKRDLLVVFQPHLFSRTKDFINEFATSLSRADDLVLLNIYPAREEPILGINSQLLLDLCNNRSKQLCSKDQLLTVLEKKKLDVLLTLGAGDIGTLVYPIKNMIN